MKNHKHTEYMMLHHQDTGTDAQGSNVNWRWVGRQQTRRKPLPPGLSGRGGITFLKRVFNIVSVVLISQLSFNKFICCSSLQCISGKIRLNWFSDWSLWVKPVAKDHGGQRSPPVETLFMCLCFLPYSVVIHTKSYFAELFHDANTGKLWPVFASWNVLLKCLKWGTAALPASAL